MSSSSSVGRLPLGVAILAILIGIFGFFVLLAGIIVILFGVGIGLAAGSTVFGIGGLVGGIIVLILGIVILAVASGLWDQELWALALAIIVLLFYGVVEFVSSSWLGLLIVVALLIYLVAVANHFD
jgi:hypothetical protein